MTTILRLYDLSWRQVSRSQFLHHLWLCQFCLVIHLRINMSVSKFQKINWTSSSLELRKRLDLSTRYRQWFRKRILSIQRANVLGRMFRTHVRWISILNPAQIVEGPHQRGLGLVWKSIVLKGLKVFTMPGKITDSKMKYEGVQTTNKTIRVYNFARWDGCWCIYIWVAPENWDPL